jgi:hypothetical protein
MANNLVPIPALDLLREALTELYAGCLFIRCAVPCDSIDREHLKTAYALLKQVVETQERAAKNGQ